MKKLLFVLCVTGLGLIACEKEEVETAVDSPPTSSYSFIDQDLQGKIEGDVWGYQSGKVNFESEFENFWFQLYNQVDTNLCDYYGLNTDHALFTLTNLKVGIYSLENTEQAVTFYHLGSDKYSFGYHGAIEILTVDTTNNMTITGRMDVWKSSSTFVNGNFSITYCR